MDCTGVRSIGRRGRGARQLAAHGVYEIEQYAAPDWRVPSNSGRGKGEVRARERDSIAHSFLCVFFKVAPPTLRSSLIRLRGMSMSAVP